jgi:hypothetical protein
MALALGLIDPIAALGGHLLQSLVDTARDVLPIGAVILFFQIVILRRWLANWRRVAAGFVAVIVGLAVFLVGLEIGLFPLGEVMAFQLTDPEFLGHGTPVRWHQYGFTYLFAFSLGFATTVAEPALIAVALKAQQVSGGTVNAVALRFAVALGVGVGVMLGVLRIIVDFPLPWFMVIGYMLVVVQTFLAPRSIVPLAYDSGGVTTSTVTVPLVVALGLGLARQIPGRNPLLDGFGLIAAASLFPMLTVMGYAQLAEWRWRCRPRPVSGEV